MNEDQLSEWLMAEHNKLKVKYTHPKDRQPSTRSKRQQLGLGDFGSTQDQLISGSLEPHVR